jgi:hypothetical protein
MTTEEMGSLLRISICVHLMLQNVHNIIPEHPAALIDHSAPWS